MASPDHVNINGHRIAYRAYGRGSRALMLCHGLVGSSVLDRETREQVEGRDLRLIIPERPGYGSSDCCEMKRVSDFSSMAAAVLEDLKIEEVDLVGISAGAPYAWAAAADWGERVNRLWILSGVPAVYRPDILNLYAGGELDFYNSLPGMSRTELQTFLNGFMADLAASFAAEGNGPDSGINLWLADSVRHNCHGMADQTRLQLREWGVDFNRIRAGVTLIHSPDDEEVPITAARKMAELLPGAVLQVLDGGGHMAAVAKGMDMMMKAYGRLGKAITPARPATCI